MTEDQLIIKHLRERIQTLEAERDELFTKVVGTLDALGLIPLPTGIKQSIKAAGEIVGNLANPFTREKTVMKFTKITELKPILDNYLEEKRKQGIEIKLD